MRTRLAARHSHIRRGVTRSLTVALVAGFAVLGTVTLPASPASAAEFATPVAPTITEAVCAPDGRSQLAPPTATAATTSGVVYEVTGNFNHGGSVYVSAWAMDGFEFPAVLGDDWQVLTPGQLATLTMSFDSCFHRTGEVVLPVITNATETCVAGEHGPVLPPRFEMPAIENASTFVIFYDANYEEVSEPILGGSVAALLTPDAFYQLPKVVPAEWVDEGDGHLFEATFGLTAVDCTQVTPAVPVVEIPATPAAAQPAMLADTGSAPIAGAFVGLGALMAAGGVSLVFARGMQRRRSSRF